MHIPMLGLAAATATLLLADLNPALAAGPTVDDDYITQQRINLAIASDGAGFGPQSPRNIDKVTGNNPRVFETAPPHSEMNLCNIHFHENAEHRGGNFTTFAGNGNGKGAGTGYKYDGELTPAELAPVDGPIGVGKYGDLQPGDTIEVHFVHSSAQVAPGPTLGACLSDSIMNPQLRVETLVVVLVNDPNARSFLDLTEIRQVNGLHQAINIPSDRGTPVQYAGSTTGPGYNEKASPFQVSWSVRPQVAKVDITTVAMWLSGNVFEEDHAHGVRNLVMNQQLLSPIAQLTQ